MQSSYRVIAAGPAFVDSPPCFLHSHHSVEFVAQTCNRFSRVSLLREALSSPKSMKLDLEFLNFIGGAMTNRPTDEENFFVVVGRLLSRFIFRLTFASFRDSTEV